MPIGDRVEEDQTPVDAEWTQEAKRRIPHFSYVEALDLTELELLRGKLNTKRRTGNPKHTLLPFFMRAVAQFGARVAVRERA